MQQQLYTVPEAVNEVPKSYAPGTPEREELQKEIAAARSGMADIPMFIGGKEIRTSKKVAIHPPHDLSHTLGHFHQGDAEHVSMAVDEALKARSAWVGMPWRERAAIFLKAAALISGPYRYKINAATMLGQSKTVYQSEIDAVCELADFLRYNVQYMTQIFMHQPKSAPEAWNRIEQRPLEGFVFALSPFNFTAIAGNLPTAPAMMGNVVVWKPANTQIYSAKVIMEVLREAGLPDGVINMVFVSGPVAGDIIFSHRDFAGIHFTGSTEVFREIWKTTGNNIAGYRSYPRIVGETGGKDFVLAHATAKPAQVATALSRGAFEYQGQKCSAASRAYISRSIWEDVRKLMLHQISSFNVGGPEDFSNFFTAVIDEKAFSKLTRIIDKVKNDDSVTIISGGGYDKSKGYFIEPTVILTPDPCYFTMIHELFGPILTIYVFEDDKYEETLELIDRTSLYGLTGAVFARDRHAINLAAGRLANAAGNFYINDKPTGAVVGHQPFGGSRASGTNDKAGSMLNLHRWVSPRTIKEAFLPPEDYRYPHQGSV
ncbi:MAG: L-glutamate gamma-semialdehyde dehydrogenase [Marinilabiliales bacterium]|nr:MAG: L-glutamate gamma-semialdehyde dehydrogenase [Marinilabiliales bacterium]